MQSKFSLSFKCLHKACQAIFVLQFKTAELLLYRAVQVINPLLGATWPFVYFLQGRLGRAAIVTRAYWFVCPAIVGKHLWCEQPVKEVQLTSICYNQLCVYSSSYSDFLMWIDLQSATFAHSTCSDRSIFIPITIAVIYSSRMYGHC